MNFIWTYALLKYHCWCHCFPISSLWFLDMWPLRLFLDWKCFPQNLHSNVESVPRWAPLIWSSIAFFDTYSLLQRWQVHESELLDKLSGLVSIWLINWLQSPRSKIKTWNLIFLLKFLNFKMYYFILCVYRFLFQIKEVILCK